jgi:DNA-directed RNA polymerase beta' subunit
MSIYKELSFENDIETIKAIQFTVMSPEEIESKSVCEIVSTDTYSGNEPIIGGLFDSRMGVIENDKICKTCNQKNTFCPGHFGHIRLAKPVFYIQFFDIVRKVLKCVCFRCSRLLMDPENPLLQKMVNKKFSRQKRFEFVYKCCTKIKRCGQENKDGCGAKLPHKTTKENIGKIIMEWKDDDVVRKNIYNAEDVLIILKRITNEEANILGFPHTINRPENLICQTFSVPPPSVRPSVRNDTGQRCEDDLTHKLCDIIKTNNTLKQKIDRDSTNPDQIDYWYILLQFHIATFVDNQLPGIPPAKQRTGRPLRSLTERLKSKEGRIRGNLMGKRVDFSARSVITPDPNIDIDELGVPMKIAMNLTFPEIVNTYNIEELYRLVMNGNDTYPGAKYIRKNEGNGYRTIRLKNLQKENIKLEFGDIVDRHLRNGDYVLFNRQPSLHKMSMMAHKVRVMSYETFRLNVCCTPSYNADYDGDEMNMHVPQSKQTEYELMALASVPTQIISPRESSPIISVVQDIVVGLYRISKDNVFVNNKQYFNILAGNSKFTGKHLPPSSQINGAMIWKGRELLSSVLNPLINLKAGKGVEIQNGVITKGTVDKKLYQDMTYGLIQYVYNELGADECKALFDNTQRLICDWLVYNGFSVGISDLIVNDTTQDKLKNVVKDLKVDVYEIISDIHMNTFENSSIMNNLDHFENLINQKLDKATKDINNIGTENINDAENRMMNMINSKSKGNPINVSQMMGSVGQQSVEGKRINYGFDNRTLPHFTKYDDGPESRGFVENSFIKGLTAQEFFFHAMGGREGLIDTAVKSVIGETEIIIIENEKIETTTIGEWIDKHMRNNVDSIQHFPEDRNMEFLELPPKSVYIPTGDDKGVVTWGELTAVTRHDPGTRVFKVKTKSGRSVTVADSESLLIWNEDTQEFKKMQSELIQIGDCVPTVSHIPQTETVNTFVKIDEHYDFKLDNTNGYAIGVYLADRTIKSGGVCFDKIIGSTDYKSIPDLTYTSPLTFIAGVIEGFVSIRKGIVDFETGEFRIDCVSSIMMEGISHLLTRLGVFSSRTSSNVLNINSKWIKQLLNSVKLSEEISIDLETLISQDRDYICDYKTINNVVMDPIVEIEILGVENYPKLYDVTVPSTLNFITMNGVNLRDTSETGYIQRKLIKAMEDAKVNFDMTVRNAGGNIIQFMYGEDSVDPIKLEKHHLDYFKFGVDITYMEESYLITERDNMKYILKDEVIKELYDTENWQDRFQQYYKQILNDREFIIKNVFNNKSDDVIYHPICVFRMIEKIENMFNLKNMNFTSELSPLYVLDKIDELIDDLRINKKTPPVKLLGVVVRHYFSPKKLIFRHRFTKDAFDYMVEHFKQRYLESLIHPSDMVGVVAAQSIGEPSTQLTLNTFHLSGVASASKAVRGVPRIKELLSVSKNMKVENYTEAKKARFSIETTYMKSLVTKSDIYYEPKNDISTIEDDQKIIDEYNKFSKLDDECYTLVSPWILRMELDRRKMMDVGLTTMDINIALKKYYNDNIMCMFSDDNNEKVIFRIALTDVDISDIITDLKALEYNIMEKIIISGIDKMKKISISQKKSQVLNDEPFRTFVDKEEYILETDGTNLSSVLANNYVNREKTISNDITEIYEIFGVEAARQALYNEIDDILNSTTSVNHRHIALLVDTMTCKGYLLSIDRHGINRSDIGPLAKCSFEETSDILIKAGVFGEIDKINGVSANIILGQIARCGTGDTQVMIDMDMLPGMMVERKIEELEAVEEGEPDCSMEFDFEYEVGNNIKVFEEKTTSKLIIT